MIQSRNDLPDELNRRGLTGQGAEIGVYEFEFARLILERWRGRVLWCVDPWCKQPPDQWRGEFSRRNDWETLWQRAKVIAKSDRRILLVRKFSAEAAQTFPDQFLDFVYLDGNHARAEVYADLGRWWPKIKPGGIFGGHDYVTDTGPPHHLEVKPALDQWARENGLQFRVTPCTSWWIYK